MNTSIIEWILTLGQHHLDLLALLLGGLVGYTLTLGLERYFLPTVVLAELIKAQRGQTFLFCWFASGTASALFWWSLDPSDALHVRLTISYLLGCLSFGLYPWIATIATRLFPKIGSSWFLN